MRNGGTGRNGKTGETKRKKRVFKYDPSIRCGFGPDGGPTLDMQVVYQITCDQLAAAWLLDIGPDPAAAGIMERIERQACGGSRVDVWRKARDYIAIHPFDPRLMMGGLGQQITIKRLDKLQDLVCSIFYQRFFMETET